MEGKNFPDIIKQINILLPHTHRLCRPQLNHPTCIQSHFIPISASHPIFSLQIIIRKVSLLYGMEILARQHLKIQIQINFSMRAKESRNMDQFEITNKNRIKVVKRELKSNLRSNRTTNKNLLESPGNSDDEQYQQKLLNRGSQWWNKVNYRFFRQVPEDDLKTLMTRTTSDELLNLRHPARQLSNYFDEQVVASNPFLGSPSFLRVLFRREVKLDRWEYYELVTLSFKQYNYKRKEAGRTVDRSLHLSSFRYPLPDRMESAGMELQRLQLDIIDVEDDQEEIKKLLRYDVVMSQGKNSVEKEIELWQKELEMVNGKNIQNWHQMIDRMKRESVEETGEIQLQSIKKELRMTEVLLYFKRGHSDKTELMLEQALQVAMIKQMSVKQQNRKKRNTRMQKLKFLFETDCKICFCTESDDKNQVVYCDSCNTSFHQACYGIETIGEDKFYCQVCQFIRKNTVADKDNPKTIKKPACQVCCKLNFPMRQLNGHFYHITCLVLFDLVQIKNYRIEFKNDYTHQSIIQKIVQNEMDSSFCAYCHKESGMKFKCAWKGCAQYFHPICAYLNGVHFELTRTYRALNSTLTCPTHYPKRDTLNQIYLRRFFCDYKGTSNKTDLEFEKEYKKEQEEKALSLALKLKWSSKQILRSGKTSKNFKCSQPRISRTNSNKERSQLALSVSISKRESSDVASNHVPPNSETEITDTRKLLLLMSDRND